MSSDLAARPLPARPNLEHERKAAKALLALLRAQDAHAWARARTIEPSLSPAPKLADAQRVMAREYGFASWPRLVRYFAAAERVGESGPDSSMFSRADFARRAASFSRAFSQQREWTAEALAAYIPRFYGRKPRDLWGETVTEADAQLITARLSGCLSWARLMELAPEHVREREDWSDHWRRRAGLAVQRGDLAAVQAVCAEHPELLTPSAQELSQGSSLIAWAVLAEASLPPALMRPMFEWLAQQGLHRDEELYRSLWRRLFLQPDELQRILDRGVDPSRLSPEGIPVLELALLRMWPSESIDLLASRCTAREALWIAAGSGNVNGVARLLDAKGVPLKPAYAIRPPWEVAWRGRGVLPVALDPEPDDLLFEALLVAVMNHRTEAATFLVKQGAPINRIWGDMTVLAFAVGNSTNLTLIQALLDGGADPDAAGKGSSQSARSLARFMLLDSVPRLPIRKEIARVLGWDPDALLAERQAALAANVPLDERVQQALREAAGDAQRDGASAITPVHLLFGIARTNSGGLLRIPGGVDAERFSAAFASRLAAPAAAETAAPLSLSFESDAIVDLARSTVRQEGRGSLDARTLILALVTDPQVAAVLTTHGADLGVLQEHLARG